MKPLLTTESPKIAKSRAYGWRNAVLYLAPHRIADRRVNVCPWSTKGCRAGCLYTSGRGAGSLIQRARIERTRLYQADPGAFVARVRREVTALAKAGPIAVRLNGTSDIDWTTRHADLFVGMPEGVRWYDYTKEPERMFRFLAGMMPRNYHLTFSRSESNGVDCVRILAAGGTVTVVSAVPLDESSDWKAIFGPTAVTYCVIDGDEHDIRFVDAPGSVVFLAPKGRARKDRSGFVFRG